MNRPRMSLTSTRRVCGEKDPFLCQWWEVLPTCLSRETRIFKFEHNKWSNFEMEKVKCLFLQFQPKTMSWPIIYRLVTLHEAIVFFSWMKTPPASIDGGEITNSLEMLMREMSTDQVVKKMRVCLFVSSVLTNLWPWVICYSSLGINEASQKWGNLPYTPVAAKQ